MSAEALTNRTILRFYYPLALSWLFMAIESPIAIFILSRLPGSEVATAGFLIMMGLSLWIESPVIDLLSTSTTLARNHQDFVTMRRFVVRVIAFVTFVHALVAFTPLYAFITQKVMGIDPIVAEEAHLGFKLLVFWSACIGWRRYLQGLLIRHGQTKRVGAGTFVRMSFMAGVGLLLFNFTELPSIEIAAIALMFSVLAEATYVHFASRPVQRLIELERAAPSENPPLTIGQVLRFHMPLTATTTLTMLGTPVVSAALSHANNPVLALAGWQVAASLIWMHRTIVFALPEVVITLYKDKQSAMVLKQFALTVGLITTSVLLITGLTGADLFVFTRLFRAKPEVAGVAHVALLACAALPLIGALQSYVRGMLTAHHLTAARFWAVVVAMVSVCALLASTVIFHVAGVLTAAGATTLSLLAELWVLKVAWNRGNKGYPMGYPVASSTPSAMASAVEKSELGTETARPEPHLENTSDALAAAQPLQSDS